MADTASPAPKQASPGRENAAKVTPAKSKAPPAKPITSFFGKAAVNAAEVVAPAAPAPETESRTEVMPPSAVAAEPEDIVMATNAILEQPASTSEEAHAAVPPVTEQAPDDVVMSGAEIVSSTVVSTVDVIADASGAEPVYSPGQPTTMMEDASVPDEAAVQPEASAATTSTPATRSTTVISDSAVLKVVFSRIHGAPNSSMEAAAKDLLEAVKAAGLPQKGLNRSILERTLKMYCENGVPSPSTETDKKGKPKPSKTKMWIVKPTSWAVAEMEAPATLVKAPEPAAPAPSAAADSTTVALLSSLNAAVDTPMKAAPAPIVKHEPDARTSSFGAPFVRVIQWATTHLMGFTPAFEGTHVESLQALTTTLESDAALPAEQLEAVVGMVSSGKLAPSAVGLELTRCFGPFATAPYVQELVASCKTAWAASPTQPLPSVFDPLLAHLIHGSAAPQHVLVQSIMDYLNTEAKMEPVITTEAIAPRVALLAGRSAYGIRPSPLHPKSDDENVCFLWRWELENMDHLVVHVAAGAGEEAAEGAKKSGQRFQIKQDDTVRKVLNCCRSYVQSCGATIDLLVTGPKNPKKVDDWTLKVSASIEKVTDALRKLKTEVDSQLKAADEKSRKTAEKAEKSASKAAAKADKKEEAKAEKAKSPAPAVPPSRSLLTFFKVATPSSPALPESKRPESSASVVPAGAPQAGASAAVAALTVTVKPAPVVFHPPKSKCALQKLERKRAHQLVASDPATWAHVDADLQEPVEHFAVEKDFFAWCIASRQQRLADITVSKAARLQARQRAIEDIRRNSESSQWEKDRVVDLTRDTNNFSSFLAAATSNVSFISEIMATPGVSRIKLLQFHRDDRPAYFGTWHASRVRARKAKETEPAAVPEEEEDERFIGVRDAGTSGPMEISEPVEAPSAQYIDLAAANITSGRIRARMPIVADVSLFNYEVDSEAEWEDGGDNADDVTDLEVASEGHDEEEEDEKPDDGLADAKGYDYEDEWLCADDECEYIKRAEAAAEKGGDEEAADAEAPAAKRMRVGAIPCGDDALMRELYTPNGDGTFDTVIGPVSYEESDEYMRTGVYPASLRQKAPRHKAWFREMVAMKTELLVRDPAAAQLASACLYITPPRGDATCVALASTFPATLWGTLTTPAAAPEPTGATEGGAGAAKRSMPAEMLPVLVQLLHGHGGSLDKVISAWKEWLKTNGKDEAIVSQRQLALKIAEISCKGKWYGPNGKPAVVTPAVVVPPAQETPSKAGSADAPEPASTGAGAPAIEHIDLMVCLQATMQGENTVAPLPAAYGKARYIVKDEVLQSVSFQYREGVAEAAAAIAATIAERKVDTIAKALAPAPAGTLSGKKRKEPTAKAAPSPAGTPNGTLSGRKRKADAIATPSAPVITAPVESEGLLPVATSESPAESL